MKLKTNNGSALQITLVLLLILSLNIFSLCQITILNSRSFKGIKEVNETRLIENILLANYKYENKNSILLSLLITSLIVINCSLLYKTLYFSNYGNKIDARLENGVATLSKELITAHSIEYGNSLTFKNEKDEQCQVILQNDRLVLTPGHNILCNAIDEVRFEGGDSLIRMEIKRNDIWSCYIVGSDYEIKNE